MKCIFVTFIGADVSLSASSLRPKPGEEVSTDCTLTGETYDGWFKISDGSRVSSSQSKTVRVETDGSKYTLRFTNVEVSQGGLYECRGSINRKTFTLNVACKCCLVCFCMLIPVLLMSACNRCFCYGELITYQSKLTIQALTVISIKFLLVILFLIQPLRS